MLLAKISERKAGARHASRRFEFGRTGEKS